MFKKILIANRGEIACRIIRTAKKLGIETVAVYSEVDANALHVKMADEAYLIGAAPSKASYLNIAAIIEIARQAQVEAIHPGYGFLSEKAEFAQACADASIVFIGPPINAIKAMGEKDTAKKIMADAGVPVIPGYYGENQNPQNLQKQADAMGYPVLIKAVAGGGGKGMRVVQQSDQFLEMLAAAMREAKSSFNDDRVLLEKYLHPARHIEVQVFADNAGNAVYLFERDCSVQRRHQKIIEEAPAPALNDTLREKMGTTAVNAARAINYTGAGTIEFLFADNQFYFMEMNTRLQVEHPVTEMITGLDLVEWQFKIAAGEPLPQTQKQLTYQGHAFEARIYAEDPAKNFMPSTGRLVYLAAPQSQAHIRIDSGVVQGDAISVYYDPLIAKLIVWGESRESARICLQNALNEFQIIGVNTNINYLYQIIAQPTFIQGELATDFVDKHQNKLTTTTPISANILATAALGLLLEQQQTTEQTAAMSNDQQSPWFNHNGWRLNLSPEHKIELWQAGEKFSIIMTKKNGFYHLLINNQHYLAQAQFTSDNQLTAIIDSETIQATSVVIDNQLHLFIHCHHYTFDFVNLQQSDALKSENTAITSPMPGTITHIAIRPGQHVNKGDSLLTIEAMKMEHTIYAPYDGVVEKLFFNSGDLVNEDVELLSFQLAKSSSHLLERAKTR